MAANKPANIIKMLMLSLLKVNQFSRRFSLNLLDLGADNLDEIVEEINQTIAMLLRMVTYAVRCRSGPSEN